MQRNAETDPEILPTTDHWLLNRWHLEEAVTTRPSALPDNGSMASSGSNSPSSISTSSRRYRKALVKNDIIMDNHGIRIPVPVRDLVTANL